MNYVIYDSDGYSLDHLTQWDVNRTLIISDLDSPVPPAVHFYNAKSARALVAQSTDNGDGSYTVKIPNSLLIQPLPVAAAIYISYTDTHECVSKEIIRLPMYPRAMPNDFVLEEDEDYINWALVTQEMLELIDEYTEITNGAIIATNNANASSAKIDNMDITCHEIAAGSQPTLDFSGGENGEPYSVDIGIAKSNGVKTVAIHYATNSNENSIPSSGWTTNIQQLYLAQGVCLWTRIAITYESNDVSTFYSKSIIAPPCIAVQDTEPANSVVVWIDTSEPGNISIPQISDTQKSSVDTYSSNKIESTFLSYIGSQSLTSAQKSRAMNNLGFSQSAETNLRLFGTIALTEL